MPKVVVQKATKPTPPPVIEESAEELEYEKDEVTGRDIVYPDYEYKMYTGLDLPGHLPQLTDEEVDALLGWMDEQSYIDAFVAQNPDVKPDNVGFGENYLFKDELGRKIRCDNNNRNRPFHEQDARKFAQQMLLGQWQFNMEPVVISRTGNVNSAQHRLVARKLARQLLEKNPQKYAKFCPDGKIDFPTAVAFGASDDPEVIQTYDNGVPRSDSDVIFTSGVFDDLGHDQREKCSNMLAKAVDLCWSRTKAGENPAALEKYKTHAASMSFVERHPKLVECVRAIWEMNKENHLTKLKLSPGQCAGMLYLMGSSSSDVDSYRNPGEDLQSSEELLAWDNWDKAVDFWTKLTLWEKFPEFKVVIDGLTSAGTIMEGEDIIADIAVGLRDKSAVLALAWDQFLVGNKITLEDLKLKRDNSEKHILLEWPGFGGIDDPELPKVAPVVTPEQAEERAAEIAAKNAEKIKMEAHGTTEGAADESGALRIEVNTDDLKELTLEQQLNAMHTKFPNKLLLWRKGAKWVASGDDARKLAIYLKTALTKDKEGYSYLEFADKALDANISKLALQKVSCVLISPMESKVSEADRLQAEITRLQKEAQGKPTPKAAPKPIARKAGK